MDMNKPTYKDAVMMVGQLLLHHPTTRTYAREPDDKECHWASKRASCFCFLGAIYRVAKELDLSRDLLRKYCTDVSKCSGHGTWDCATSKQRDIYIQRLVYG